MNTKQFLITIVLLALSLPSHDLFGQYFAVKSFQMTVKGSSTMHDWTATVHKVECKSSFKIENTQLVDISQAVVKIQVVSIQSEKGKIMDNKIHDAFKYEKYPDIRFILVSHRINSTNRTAELKGTLSMAGTTRPVELTITYKILSTGELQIKGSKKLKMTDFNIEPPTAIMGTIKVGNEVVVEFDITLEHVISTL